MIELQMTSDKYQVGHSLAKWATRDPDSAFEYLRSQPPSRTALGRRALFRSLVELDPAAALELAKEHFVDEMSPFEWGYSDVALQLARYDLEATLAIREGWSAHLQKATASAMAAATFKKGFASGLAFMESEGLGWRDMVEVLGVDYDRKIFKALLENSKELPQGWMESILQGNSKSFGYGNGPKLGWLESDAEALGVSEEIFSNFTMSLSQVSWEVTESERARFMRLLNDANVNHEVRGKLLRQQVSKWPVWDSDGLKLWKRGF